MSVKILTSTLVGLNDFCQDPISELMQADKGTLAVLHHNSTVFYALTPQRLTYLLKLESTIKSTIDVSKYNNHLCNPELSLLTPVGKFAMYQGWKPDDDFQCQAAIWGIVLNKPVTPPELASFISYWKAEGRQFHHVQWQQKLARSIQMNRLSNNIQKKYNLSQFNNTNYDIPDGFRGE